MKIVYYTAMHERHETVKRCIEYNLRVKEQLKEHGIELDFIYGYSLDRDGLFLSNYDVHTYQIPNTPFYAKFNGGMKMLESMDFDVVVMMGSDDIAEVDYYLSIAKHSKKYDHIAFKDIYFYDTQTHRGYYWGGYTNYRKGEPAGAGKAYTRKAMETINFDLFRPSIDNGLDRGCWLLTQEHNMKTKLLSVKEDGFLCDIKDRMSKTPLRNFTYLERANFDLSI